MKEGTFANFGLLIAYVVPGFATVWAFSYRSPVVEAWLRGSAAELPTVGGFLYVTLASMAAGLTVSTIRWMLIDSLHHVTGIPPAQWDFSRLQANIDAYRVLVEIHYRYYQFYANTLVATALLYVAVRGGSGHMPLGFGSLDVLFITVEVVLFAGSRDTLRKYYLRGTQLLAPSSSSVTAPLLVRQLPRNKLAPRKPLADSLPADRDAGDPPPLPEGSLQPDHHDELNAVLGQMPARQTV